LARLPEDTDRDEELLLARTAASEAALAALPGIAADLGVDDDVVLRVRADYEEHLAAVRAEAMPADDGNGEDGRRGNGEDGRRDAAQMAAARRELDRELRLRVLAHKRSAVTDLRDSGHIDDIVLREVQASMDIEEVRLLGPADAE